jgi:HSP20 family protein
MSLTKWRPFQELMTMPDAAERLFDDSLFQPLSLFGNQTTLPMDIIDNENELLVRAAAPGFEPEDFDISVQGDSLTLRGSTREEHGEENERYYLREYRVRNFQRTVRLPAHVNADQVMAEYRNGILNIRLPKAEQERTRRIAVQSAQGE